MNIPGQKNCSVHIRYYINITVEEIPFNTDNIQPFQFDARENSYSIPSLQTDYNFQNAKMKLEYKTFIVNQTHQTSKSRTFTVKFKKDHKVT